MLLVGEKMDNRIRRVIFDEEQHKYWFDAKELKGVTGAIGKKLGHVFPEGVGHVEVGKEYGKQLHSDVEHYFNDKNDLLATEGSKWVIEELETFGRTKGGFTKVECEVTVSDFEGTASKVDVVAHTNEGVFLFDIKTTSKFDREYCSLQLSTYAYLYEQNYGENVLGLFVLGTKSKRLFRIIYQGEDKVKNILEMNKC